MAGVNRIDLRLDALAVAARVDLIPNIEPAEGWQPRSRVADAIIGRVERFRPQEIARRSQQCRMTEPGYLRHLPQPHVRAQGHQTAQHQLWIRVALDIPVQHMLEGGEKAGVLRHEPQQSGYADAGQLAVERTVDRLLDGGIDQAPVLLVTAPCELDVLIGAGGDSPIDVLNLGFQLLVKLLEGLLNRLQKDLERSWRVTLWHQLRLLLVIPAARRLRTPTSP